MISLCPSILLNLNRIQLTIFQGDDIFWYDMVINSIRQSGLYLCSVVQVKRHPAHRMNKRILASVSSLSLLIIDSVAGVSQHVLFMDDLLVKQV